jgi:hypothetical protein
VCRIGATAATAAGTIDEAAATAVEGVIEVPADTLPGKRWCCYSHHHHHHKCRCCHNQKYSSHRRYLYVNNSAERVRGTELRRNSRASEEG